MNPKDPDPYVNRAVAYFLEKEYDKTWVDVKKAQALGGRINPEFLEKLRKTTGRNG